MYADSWILKWWLPNLSLVKFKKFSDSPWIHVEGIILSESFEVDKIIEKLPSGGWKEFKIYLKHKRKEMNIEDIIIILRIDEDNKSSERILFSPAFAKANVVEHGQSSKKCQSTQFGKWTKLRPKECISKNKFSGKCYNCGGEGHKYAECWKPKKNQEENLVEDITK